MWIGPGGVIAGFVAVWGGLWAARRTAGRPREELAGTVVPLVGLQAGVVLASAQTTLVVGFAEMARASSTAERAVLHDALRDAYGPLIWGALAMVGLAAAVGWSSRRWSASRGAPALSTALGSLAIVGAVALSLAAVAAFHTLFVAGGPSPVHRQAARAASAVLLAGGAAAWCAIAASVAWLAARAWAAVRSGRVG